MTAQEMIDQAHDFADDGSWNFTERLIEERRILRDIIRHLCDPENVPYPMTSPEL